MRMKLGSFQWRQVIGQGVIGTRRKFHLNLWKILFFEGDRPLEQDAREVAESSLTHCSVWFCDSITNYCYTHIWTYIHSFMFYCFFLWWARHFSFIFLDQMKSHFKSYFNAPCKIFNDQYFLLSFKTNLAVSLLSLHTPTCWACFTSINHTHIENERAHIVG